jgi:hypothetical protein
MKDTRAADRITFFLLGTAIGAVAALLVAPASGARTRRTLRRKGEHAPDGSGANFSAPAAHLRAALASRWGCYDGRLVGIVCRDGRRDTRRKRAQLLCVFLPEGKRRITTTKLRGALASRWAQRRVAWVSIERWHPTSD